MTELDPIKDGRVEPREERECPNCGGTLLEPRSSEWWHCAKCARRFRESEIDE